MSATTIKTIIHLDDKEGKVCYICCKWLKSGDEVNLTDYPGVVEEPVYSCILSCYGWD